MKKLIIVCDEKRRKFGDYLAQLISMEDDSEETIVGIEDGSVEAVVWLEKEYNANSQTISSEQHILFIGNSKELRAKREFMNVEFSEYGMKYGSLGKQAFIAVDKVVKHKEYQEFYSFAKCYAENLEEVVKKRKTLTKEEKAKVSVAGVGTGALAAKGTVAGVASVGGVTALAVLGPMLSIPLALYAKKSKEIKKQMYSCAVMKFFVDYLSVFLGL